MGTPVVVTLPMTSPSGVILALPDNNHITAGCALYDLLVCGVVVGISCLLGLVGNAVSFLILRTNRRRSVTAFLLTVLAAGDSAFLVPAALLTVPPAVCRFQPDCCGNAMRAALPVVDQYGWAVASTAHTFTVYVTVLVTWHRYTAVCRPHAATAAFNLPVAKRSVVAVAAFAVLYNIPRFMEFNVNVTLVHDYSIPQSDNVNNGDYMRNITKLSKSSDGNLSTYPHRITENPELDIYNEYIHESQNATAFEESLYSLTKMRGTPTFSSLNLTNTSILSTVDFQEDKTSTNSLHSTTDVLSYFDSTDNITSVPYSKTSPPLVILRTRIITTRTLTELGRNPWYQVVYKNICFYIFIYIIPLITLLILTTRLAQALRRRRYFRYQASMKSRKEDGTTLVLIIVVVAFLICQTPTLFQRMFYTLFGDEGLKCGHFFFYFERVADYFAILNSCVNFIIYIMFSRQFRKVLVDTVRRKTRSKRKKRRENGLEKSNAGCIDPYGRDRNSPSDIRLNGREMNSLSGFVGSNV